MGTRKIELTWSVTVCEGLWTVTRYTDGTQTASLTERWDTPLPLDELVTRAQRDAQRAYEEQVVAR